MRFLSILTIIASVAACSNNINPTATSTPKIEIALNQLGFSPNSEKTAIITGLGNTPFKIIAVHNNQQAFTGILGTLSYWQPADKEVSIADFSELTIPGEYRIEIANVEPSPHFKITRNIFTSLHDATIKAYYFNRASTELLATHAGEYARPAGHPDTHIMVHSSAASAQRPAGTLISSPKGWYDAGDYGKYVVNSGISTYTLMIAYEHFPQLYTHQDLNIPESDNTIPDILDEIKWNLDWLQTMQDPNDGGVYHKLTTLNFAGAVMPHQADAQRYVVQKGTAATLNLVAVMAVASRIFRNFELQFPGLAATYQAASIDAWQWANSHNNLPYLQPDDVVTGQYDDTRFNDEFAWAAAELYLLTEDVQYLHRFKQENVGINIPEWAHTQALGYISLINQGQSLLSTVDLNGFQKQLLEQADQLAQQHQQSAYRVAMIDSDFIWGSNAVVMNKAMILLQAYALSPQAAYKSAALGLLDYILGKNPASYSYVTGFGNNTPMHIHHRQSEADAIVNPVPGFMAGGPQNGWQDGCDYPSKSQARSYLDDYCSYSTNEITINWNAPLVYVLAGFLALEE